MILLLYGKKFCILYKDVIAVLQEYNIYRHYQTKLFHHAIALKVVSSASPGESLILHPSYCLKDHLYT